MGEFNYKKEYDNWKWNIPEKYNIGFDCVDKHTLTDKKNKVALYWENFLGETDKFTYNEMKRLTNKFGNALKNLLHGDSGTLHPTKFSVRQVLEGYIRAKVPCRCFMDGCPFKGE